ncbi:MAG TPA: hypothetical protein VFJ78_05005 [Gaiellaceae bacterium]|nr:hypothetical protein [Gaiellaceae bacterium]
MRRISSAFRRRLPAAVVSAAGVVALVAACDKDPSAPSRVFPTLTVLNDSVVGRQEALRILFTGDSLSAATALDEANFVVINECTGLRVPGSLRLGRAPGGDTLIFTPTQALPYLTRVGVRVQNLLTPSGASIGIPQTFTVRTENPPVSDLTWKFLESPTNDAITGINFADRTTGYAVTDGGAVYRTTDGGLNFVPRYKDLSTNSLAEVRAFGDTLYVVGARSTNTGQIFGLLRSVNQGLTFDVVGVTPAFLYRNDERRAANGTVIGLVGGLTDRSNVYRYDATAGTLVESTGIPTGNYLTTSVALSPNATNAISTFLGFPFTAQENTGLAVRSTNGGVSFTNIALPANTYGLNGSGFIDETHALILGDSSVVLRVDVTTGAVTSLGAAQGIPQTIRSGPGDFTTFSFTKASFAPGSQVGFVVGTLTRRQPNRPDVVDGVILISRDGGQTFTRQAIADAPDNGQGFPLILDVQALAPDFSVLGGANGLLAARTSNEDRPVAVCSLTQP